jgi:hypothetical protein
MRHALIGPICVGMPAEYMHIDYVCVEYLSDMNYFCVNHPVAMVAHRAQTAHLFPGRYAILPGACCSRIVTIMPQFLSVQRRPHA